MHIGDNHSSGQAPQQTNSALADVDYSALDDGGGSLVASYGFFPTRRLFSLPIFFLREVTRRFFALSLPLLLSL